MSTESADPKTRYSAVVDALLGERDVTLGGKDGVQSRSTFGANALRMHNKIFAMLSSKGQFVVKLPKLRVDALVAAGVGERFDPGHGRLMKEWLAVYPDAPEDWLALAREAMAFVART